MELMNLIIWTKKSVCIECAPEMNIEQAFIKGINFHFEKKTLVGIVSSQHEGKYLLQFLSGRDPDKKMDSFYTLKIDGVEFDEIHQISDMLGLADIEDTMQYNATPL